jgi:hypothetical protein
MWARIAFHGWVLRSFADWRGGRGRGAATVGKRGLNPSPGRGVYIALRVLSVVPTGRRYYRGSPKIETESSYRYTAPGSVLPGGSGSTGTGSVVPGVTRNSNRELISVLPTLCRLYRWI